MSSYNGEKYIREQIDSILSQVGDFQLDLWIRDDGSKDSTKKILQQYANEGKLRWYSGSNLRPAKSFMDLLFHCPGYDLYSFADQDDYWMPNKIDAAVKKMEGQKGYVLYFGNAELVGSDLSALGRNVYKKNPKTDFETLTCAAGILGCTLMINSELAKQIQEIELPKNFIMHDFYIGEVCLALGGRIVYDPVVYMKYRQHENNVVGVANGALGIIKNRFKKITEKAEIGIAEQAQEIIRIYGKELRPESYKWLKQVAEYRNSLVKRIRLAVSRRTSYVNKNAAVTIRVGILLGNR